jgi:hypothetical protein
MHFVVTLAAVLTVLLPILFYCGQNLGVETLSIDHCPLLGNDWVKNSVYMLLLCAAWKEPCYLRDFIVYKMDKDIRTPKDNDWTRLKAWLMAFYELQASVSSDK